MYGLYAIVLFSLLTVIANGQKSATKEAIDQLLSKKHISEANISFYVYNLNDNKVVASFNKETSLIPASIQKLITTGMAIKTTGPEYRYRTELQYDGYIQNDTLFGNLYLKGGGDPTFGSKSFDSVSYTYLFSKFLNVLKRNHIKAVEGSVVADASVFDSVLFPKQDWSRHDYGNYYGSGTCGVNFHENFYTVYFRPGKSIGSPAQVLKTEPEIPGLKFENKVTTAGRGTGDKVYIYGEPYNSKRELTGTVPLGTDYFPVKGSLPDPAFACAWHLKEYLTANGIKITGNCRRVFVNDTGRMQLALHLSPPMEEIIAQTNYHSNNMFAETLFKTIAADGRVPASYLSVRDIVKQEVGIHSLILDGSGLSRNNKLSAHDMVEFLKKMYHSHVFEKFYASIPVACKQGTVKKSFCITPLNGNMRVKSGSMGGVKSYAGYMKNSQENLLAFCIIMNNYHVSSNKIYKEIESLLKTLY